MYIIQKCISYIIIYILLDQKVHPEVVQVHFLSESCKRQTRPRLLRSDVPFRALFYFLRHERCSSGCKFSSLFQILFENSRSFITFFVLQAINLLILLSPYPGCLALIIKMQTCILVFQKIKRFRVKLFQMCELNNLKAFPQ